MTRWLRRLLWLGALAGAGFGAYRVWQRRQAAPAEPPQWPPFAKESPVAEPAPLWVAPVNGTCPDGYLVKANDNSGIFHVPGGRFYDRTVAERCYANADAAIADGYRPAKA
jgi:hypothetical protein